MAVGVLVNRLAEGMVTKAIRLILNLTRKSFSRILEIIGGYVEEEQFPA